MTWSFSINKSGKASYITVTNTNDIISLGKMFFFFYLFDEIMRKYMREIYDLTYLCLV